MWGRVLGCWRAVVLKAMLVCFFGGGAVKDRHAHMQVGQCGVLYECDCGTGGGGGSERGLVWLLLWL